MRKPAAVAALALVATLSIATVGNAAPSNTKITAVYLTSKCGGTCGPGDPTLSNQAVVSGTIQVDAASDDGIGFSSVRLEALGPGDPSYSCIHIWQPTSGGHFSGSATWNTKNWTTPSPSNGCNEIVVHKHGEPTANGSYSLRVVAVERSSNAQQISSTFTIRLANPADPPIWRDTPTVNGNAVTVRWYRNVETDVIEYRINRTDSKGTKVIALSATSPASTPGCLPEQEATFTCTDHPASGTVRYSIQAFRPTPASAPNCKAKATPCVGSPQNAKKTVTVAGTTTGQTQTPHAVPSPNPRTSSSPTPPRSSPGPTGTATETTPGTSRTPFAFPAPIKTQNRTVPIALAAIAMLAVTAVLVLRSRSLR
jgi:hypothetical protein